jgi:glycosyltransferase involved in cell wall biosynthesis
MNRSHSIGIFGTFYPMFQKTGNSTTALTILLNDSGEIGRIHCFTQRGAEIPASLQRPRQFELVPCWTHGNTVSLIRALFSMHQYRKLIDVYLFNIHVTSFGSRGVTNAVGLLLPPLIRFITGHPVVVFLHNAVETQDYRLLGYSPSRMTLFVVRLLESLLARATRLTVPLKSQAITLRQKLGHPVHDLFIPYLEAIHGFVMSRGKLSTISCLANGGRSDVLRVLTFGHWGPQKDLRIIADLQQAASAAQIQVRLTVAGDINANFPTYAAKLEETLRAIPKSFVDFVGPVPEDDVLRLMATHDVLVLPYTATGGYSGAMSAAAFAGLPVIAYDLPQLRESAKLLNCDIRFVPPRSIPETAQALREVIDHRSRFTLDSADWPLKYELSRSRALSLINSGWTEDQ